MPAFAMPSDRDYRPDRSNGPRALDHPSSWAKDGRTREARFLKNYQQRLLAHIGGTPSTVQAELIRRASRLALHLELADARALAGIDPPAQAQKNYIALSTQLVRCLQALGIKKPTEQVGPTLAEIVASGRKR